MGRRVEERRTAGTYTMGDSHYVRGRVEQELTVPGSLWPEARVLRTVCIDGHNVRNWEHSMTRFGQAAIGLGTVRSYGSMIVSYIDATQMGKMIAHKRPDLFEGSRKQYLQYLRGLEKDLGAFIHEQSVHTVEQMNRIAEGTADAKAIAPVPGIWGHAQLDVCEGVRGGFGGGFEGALVFEDPELIVEEMHAICGFFKHGGFNPSYIRRDDRPHMSCIDTFAPTGKVAFDMPDLPSSIVLNPPSMRVMTNSPV